MRRSSLREEIRQTRPFHSAAQEALLALFRTVDLIRRQVTAVLETADVTHQQYNVLRILRGAGPEGLPTLAIAERMVERTPGITRLIDRLEKKGWVVRERDERDRRRVQCRITPPGLDLLGSLDEPIREVEERCLAMLEEEEKRQLIGWLECIRGELQDE